MRVVLTEALFDPSTYRADPLALHALFRFGRSQRHAVMLGFKQSTSLHFNSWLSAQAAAVREAVHIALRHGRKAAARDTTENVVYVEPRGEPQWTLGNVRLPPELAVDLLSEPLSILVEDRESDGAFLQAVALGWHRDTLRELLEKRWVQFDNGGGLSIKRHRLKRRAMENYIPPHELHDYWQRRGPLERKQAAAASMRLHPSQRNHYCMWSGLAGDRERPNKGDTATRAEIEALFSNPPVPEKDKALLEEGFGEEIAEIFQPDEARGRPFISEERLRLDNQAEEMEPLFRNILRWV